MRCTWFTKASRVPNSLAFFHPISPAFLYPKRPQFFSSQLSNFRTKIPAAAAYASTAASHSTPKLKKIYRQDVDTQQHQPGDLTAAQMSRAAWNAVHVSSRGGDLSTAYLVLHSVRNSHLQNDPKPRIRQEHASRIISFSKPVSERLSGHALLHELLRLGVRQRAYRLAQRLIADGVRLHHKTLEAVVHGILDPDSQEPPSSVNGELYIRWKALLPTSNVLTFSPAVSTNPSIRRAIQILQTAREHNQQQSEKMFSAVIKACLLHGELLAASLIFTAIVKACTAKDVVPVSTSTTNESHASAVASKPRRAVCFHPPHSTMMSSIVSAILEIIDRERRGPDGTFDVAFQVALQALANLASLLDLRRLPFGEVASLLRALYTCPKVDNTVWIETPYGKRKRVPAYKYFHGVLQRLAFSPPTKARLAPHIQPYAIMPGLDRYSCNSLLHYSLRHRLSTSATKKVLSYLNERHQPDATTLNILLTAGRILRVPDLAENALDKLRLFTNEETKYLPIPFTETEQSSLSKVKLTPHLKRLAKGKVDHFINNVNIPQPVDAFTMSAYISYLTVTGRAESVAEFLFELLPELAVIITSPAEDPEDLEMREACLKRVVPLGPYFFVAFLNALRKTGQIGLAQCVWKLAKEAEMASWVEEFREESKPWMLPVHAYTVMIQLYGEQAIRGKRRERVGGHEEEWDPRPSSARMIEQRERELALRQPGVLAVSTYDSMMSGAKVVYEQLIQTHNAEERHTAQLPQPDARFFNAILRMVTRHPGMVKRRAHHLQSHWKDRIRYARRVYLDLGTSRDSPNAYLEEVTMDMMKHGFPIPPGLEYLLVGRDPVGMERYRQSYMPLDKTPYAYPKLRATSPPFTLPVAKSKGLPGRRVGRKKWRRQRIV